MGHPQPLLYVTYSYTPTTQDVDKAHAMSDLNMLRGPGGLERSEKRLPIARSKWLSPNFDSLCRPLQRHRSACSLTAIRRTVSSRHLADIGILANDCFAPEAAIGEQALC
jgi:hypothetical protein